MFLRMFQGCSVDAFADATVDAFVDKSEDRNGRIRQAVVKCADSSVD